MGYFHCQCICVYRDGEMYPHIVHQYMDYGHVIIVITFHVIMCVYICVYIACEYVCMYVSRNPEKNIMKKRKSSYDNIVLYSTSITWRFAGTFYIAFWMQPLTAIYTTH